MLFKSMIWANVCFLRLDWFTLPTRRPPSHWRHLVFHQLHEYLLMLIELFFPSKMGSLGSAPQ